MPCWHFRIASPEESRPIPAPSSLQDGSIEIRGTDPVSPNNKSDKTKGKKQPSRNKRRQPQTEDANDRQPATE